MTKGLGGVAIAAMMVLPAAANSAGMTNSASCRGLAESAQMAAETERVAELKKLVGEILRAVEAKDSAKVREYLAALVIPEHKRWFTETFGGEEGPRLEAIYASLE